MRDEIVGHSPSTCLQSGRCTSLTALSDFVENLKLGGYFKPPEILDSQVEPGQALDGGALTRFSVKATIVTPGS